MWPEYEIRLLRGRATTLVYWLCCMDDHHAEVWRGDLLVHAEPCLRVVGKSRAIA
jgi:hypothetical protein